MKYLFLFYIILISFACSKNNGGEYSGVQQFPIQKIFDGLKNGVPVSYNVGDSILIYVSYKYDDYCNIKDDTVYVKQQDNVFLFSAYGRMRIKKQFCLDPGFSPIPSRLVFVPKEKGNYYFIGNDSKMIKDTIVVN
jgi:hypothetical protein